MTVYFKDDKVEKFDGGNLPTEREYIDRIAGKAKSQAGRRREEERSQGSAMHRDEQISRPP